MSENYNAGFSSSLSVTDAGVTLPNIPARRVKLSNWYVANNTTFDSLNETQFANGHEVYYGYGGNYSHQLFPGRDSDWLNVNNLSEISLRARPNGNIKIYFSYET